MRAEKALASLPEPSLITDVISLEISCTEQYICLYMVYNILLEVKFIHKAKKTRGKNNYEEIKNMMCSNSYTHGVTP